MDKGTSTIVVRYLECVHAFSLHTHSHPTILGLETSSSSLKDGESSVTSADLGHWDLPPAVTISGHEQEEVVCSSGANDGGLSSEPPKEAETRPSKQISQS